MRYLIIALSILLCPVISAHAQVGISIGINMPSYPELVQVPGYPVYYDPQVDSNYFFYDGQYWVYTDDNWYASTWYNGPWELVEPYDVPLFVLRVPVRYYRRPPAYFRGWQVDISPRWGEHWGRGWEDRRRGWDTWDRHSIPLIAPLPLYQRGYSGARYPHSAAQQYSIRSSNYRYQPRETITRQHFEQHGTAGSSRVGTQVQIKSRAIGHHTTGQCAHRVATPGACPAAIIESATCAVVSSVAACAIESAACAVVSVAACAIASARPGARSTAIAYPATTTCTATTPQTGPQDRGGKSKPEPQGKGSKNKNDEHGH